MSSINDYKARVSGKTIKSTTTDNTIHFLKNNIVNSPSYYEVSINNSSSLYGVQIVDDSNVRDQKLITCLDYQLKNGDIIDWQSSKWINVLTDNMSDIYYRGSLRRCVGQLKWLDSNGLQKERYFTFKSDSSTNFGVQDGRIMTLGNERRNLMAPLDDDTKLIGKDKRFIFDGRAWKVSSVDRISVDGLIILTVDEDEIRPSIDNVELGVANYYIDQATYEVFIANGNPLSLQVGNSIQLNVTVKRNSVELDNPTVTYTSSNPLVASVNSSGLVSGISEGSVIITVSAMGSSTQLNISVSALGAVDNFAISISSTSAIPNEIRKGQTKTYQATVFNNGVLVSDQAVQFELFSDDMLSPTTLATINSQSSTGCIVKNINSTTGFIQLKVSLLSNPSVFKWQRIEMKSLF